MSSNPRTHTSPSLKIHKYVHNDNRYTRSLTVSNVISLLHFLFDGTNDA